MDKNELLEGILYTLPNHTPNNIRQGSETDIILHMSPSSTERRNEERR